MLFSRNTVLVLFGTIAIAVLGRCEAKLLRTTASSSSTSSSRKLQGGDDAGDDTDKTENLTIVDSVPQESEDYNGAENENESVIIVVNKETDSSADEAEYGFACQTIHDLICNEALFSKLCTLLYETDPEVGQALESGEWTLFAPQDSAFDIPDVAAILADLRPKELMRIVKFHAVEGRTLWPWDLACTETLAMYSGDMSRTRCEKDAATGLITKYQKGNGNYNLGLLPKLELPSLRACNGIVHVLDMVMLPVGGKTATAITEAEEEGASALVEDEDNVTTLVPSSEETYSADLSKSNSDGAATAKMINCPGKAGPPKDGTSCAAAKPNWTKKNASWSGQCTNTAWSADQNFETTTKSVCDCSTKTNLVWGCSVISSIVPIVGTPSPDGDGSWCPEAPPTNNDKCPLPSSYTSGECSWSMSTWYDGPNGMGGDGGWVVETTDCTCTKETPFFACTQSLVAK